MATQQQGPSAAAVAQNAIKEAFADLVSSQVVEAVGATGPVVQPVEPLVAAERELSKQDIKKEFSGTKLPDGASKDEAAQFDLEKREFSGVLDRGGDNTAALREKLQEIRDRLGRIQAAIAGRKAAKAEIEREFALLDFTTMDQAPAAEREPVNAIGAEIRAALVLVDVHNRVDELGDKLNRVRKGVAAVRESIERRKKAKVEIENQLTGLPWAAIEGAPDDEKQPLNALRTEALDKLRKEPLDNEAVEHALSIASDLARQVDELARIVEQRLSRKRDIEEGAKTVTLPPEADPDSLAGARNNLSDVLKKQLSEAALVEAEQLLQSLRAEADVVRENTEKLIAKRAMFRKQLEGALQVIPAHVKSQAIVLSNAG